MCIRTIRFQHMQCIAMFTLRAAVRRSANWTAWRLRTVAHSIVRVFYTGKIRTLAYALRVRTYVRKVVRYGTVSCGITRTCTVPRMGLNVTCNDVSLLYMYAKHTYYCCEYVVIPFAMHSEVFDLHTHTHTHTQVS